MADNPSDRSDADESNVSHFLFRTPPSARFLPGTIGSLRAGAPQFPPTLQGHVERMFKQEYLDNERQRRLDEANERAQRQLEQAAEVAKRLAEAAAAANAAADKLAALSAAPEPPPDTDEYRSVLHPGDWNSYQGFRASMLASEAAVRIADDLKATDPLPKWKVAEDAGSSVRTITRRQKHFGLDPKKHWPPSTWPEQQPRPRLNQALLFGHAAAAAMVISGCLGKLDPSNAARWLLTS